MGVHRKRIERNELLFQEGDQGNCAYLVESGRIRIVLNAHGENRVLGEIGPGQYFGEMALISHQPRMASAIACQDSVLTVVTREHLQERLDKSDEEAVSEGFDQDFHLDSAEVDEQMAITRMRTEQALMEALERDQFRLYFQPIVRLADRVTAGFEALLRWEKPGEGLVRPDLFIPIAEESHLIEELGRWIINEACRCRSELARQYQQPLDEQFSVSINLAARQFQDDRLTDTIREALRTHDLNPRSIRMEVTESQIMDDFEHTLKVLEDIRATGCKIAIDDFGTGHSSLAYLSRLPVDTLKIDKAFLEDALSDESSQKIIAGVAALARNLGMTFIAEGGETAEQISLLQSLGVTQVQGYFFSKPFPLSD